MKIKSALLGAALAAIAFTPTAGFAATNIVQNPGFEAGSTDWAFGGWFTTSGIASVTPFEGNLFASTGCVNQYCSLQQNLATTAGASYDLSFAFNPGLGVPFGGADTRVYWDGVQVADLGLGDLGWTVYTYNGLVASSSSTSLLFSGYQNPAWNGVDAVTVTPVPELSTWAMMLAGMAGLGFAGYRRNKAASVAA